ncbi:HEAT repeat-containing protein 4 [Nothoprocta perdicaria]|uniref:HEAT repeat-containing protein 4 n=1 Tax=Nothoprocta perdicaria TaxID=30464 RepID=UPI000E1B9117|nr:HEAT repeat-containing protein 4 [Nothoprocta perdicaria]
MTSQDFSHSDQHQLYYLRKYVRHIVESLSFSKDVLEQQGLSYKEYNFKHLYDPSDIIQKPKRTAKIVHQVDEGMKDFFILENHDQYCKHLQQPFPRQPECWGCKSQRRTAWRPKKGAFRWIALPTLTPYFVQNDEESPPTKAKEVQKEFKEPNKEVSWETQVLRATLEQWKDAWDLQLGPLLSEALRDPNAHVRMASALCHYALGDRSEEARAVMKDALEHGNSADSWAAAQCLALESAVTVPVVAKLLSQLFEKSDAAAEEQACLLLAHLGERTPLVHFLLTAQLNSPRWTARARACRALPGAGEHPSQDLTEKLSQLMWEDWNARVRQAATLALGHMELAKEIHDSLTEKLSTGSCQTKVQALSLIRQLHYMTETLFPGFLQCFSSDFVAVRKEACLTAGALGIKDEQVLQCLSEMMQYDPHWIIKVFAIRALGEIGHVSPELKDHLLWALHYEEEADVRREACCCIATLCLQDENVRATLLQRLVLEPDETVREEVAKTVKILNFAHEEDQEMIKEIKEKIFRLSQKDLVTQKLQKLENVMDWLRQKVNRIGWSREDIDSECEDILERITAVFQSTPGQNPSTLGSETEIQSTVPQLAIDARAERGRDGGAVPPCLSLAVYRRRGGLRLASGLGTRRHSAPSRFALALGGGSREGTTWPSDPQQHQWVHS